ncbi:MAG TPA: hypothetical protein VG477_15485 [Thermoanaerobaculia bacterium]|nr:hypothetical protein [Thermoanaerobaculia bacterium]
MQSRAEASSIAWSWRDRAAQKERSRVREAAAARKHGVTGGLIGLAAAAFSYYVLQHEVAGVVIAVIAVILALIALVSPLGLHKKVTRVLERFAHAVGSGVTWVLMTILYFLVFLPVGLFLRARRRLGITQGPDRSLPTYWTRTEERAKTPESYRRQF